MTRLVSSVSFDLKFLFAPFAFAGASFSRCGRTLLLCLPWAPTISSLLVLSRGPLSLRGPSHVHVLLRGPLRVMLLRGLFTFGYRLLRVLLSSHRSPLGAFFHASLSPFEDFPRHFPHEPFLPGVPLSFGRIYPSVLGASSLDPSLETLRNSTVLCVVLYRQISAVGFSKNSCFWPMITESYPYLVLRT